MPINETVESGAGCWRQEDCALYPVLVISLLTAARNSHGNWGLSLVLILCLTGCFSRTCRAWRSVQVLAVLLCLCPSSCHQPPLSPELSDCVTTVLRRGRRAQRRGQRGHLRVGVEQVHDFLHLTDCRAWAIETGLNSDSFACFAGRVVSYLTETALVPYLTTPMLLKNNAIKRDEITLG